MSRTDSKRLRGLQQSHASSSDTTSFTSEPSTSFSAEYGQISKIVGQHDKHGSHMKNVKEIITELCKNPDKIDLVMGLLKEPDNEIQEGRKITRSISRRESAMPAIKLKPIAPPMTFLDINFGEEDDEEYVPEKECEDQENTFFSQSDIDSEISERTRTYQLRSQSTFVDFAECIPEEEGNLYYTVVDDDYAAFVESVQNHGLEYNDLDFEDPDDYDFEINPNELDEHEPEVELNIPRSEVNHLFSDLIEVEPPPEEPQVVQIQGEQLGALETANLLTTSDSLVNIKNGYIPKFTKEERNQLKAQMAMHVQQLMQTVMITHEVNGLTKEHEESLQMMQDIVNASTVSPLSHFAVSNIPAAVETLEYFLSHLVVWPDIFSNELFKSHLWQFPTHKVMWTLANSPAVLYPELLVVQRAQPFPEPYNKFIESEDLLLAMALLQFKHVKHSSCANRMGKNHLISKLLLVNKTSNQIKYHMKNIRNKTSEVYQLITRAEKAKRGEHIEFPKYTFTLMDKGPPLQWDPECPVQPFWLKELRKSLYSDRRHKTVTELPMNTVLQIQCEDSAGADPTAENNENDPVKSVDPAGVESETESKDAILAIREAENHAAIAELDVTIKESTTPAASMEDDDDTDITEILEEGHVPLSQSTPRKKTVEVVEDESSTVQQTEQHDEETIPRHQESPRSPRKEPKKQSVEKDEDLKRKDKVSTSLADDSDDIIITETDNTFEEMEMDETFEADISTFEEVDISQMAEETDAQMDESKGQPKPFCPRNEDSLLWMSNDDEGLSCSTYRIQTPKPYNECDPNIHNVIFHTPAKYVDPWADDSCSVPTHLKTPNFSREVEVSVQITPKKKSSASRKIFEIDPPDIQESHLLSPARKASTKRKETDFERAKCMTDPSRRSEQLSILSQIIWDDIRIRLFMHDHVLSELQKIIELDKPVDEVLEELGKLVDDQQETVLYLIAFLIPREQWPADLRNNHTCLNLYTALQRILVIEAFHSKTVRRSAIKNIFTAIARLGETCTAQQVFDKLNKHFGSHKILWSQVEELFPDACFNKRVLPNEYEHYNLYDSDHGEDLEQFEKIDINCTLGKVSNRIPHDVTIDKGRVFVRQHGRQVQVDFTPRIHLSDNNDEDSSEDSICKRRRRSSTDEASETQLDTVILNYSEQHQQNSTYGNKIPWSEENDDAMIVCLEQHNYNAEESVQMYIKKEMHIGPEKPSIQETRARMTMLCDLVSDYIETRERTSITLR
uniref:GON-4-like protein n=1 Tax=Steinernema glaseri TaxID=37863 RepID=A0A1I8AUJ9_9BILA